MFSHSSIRPSRNSKRNCRKLLNTSIYSYDEEDTVDEDGDSSIVYSSSNSRDVLPFKYPSIEEFKKKLPKITEHVYLYAQQKELNLLPFEKTIMSQTMSA
ncbi:hypothetical protein PR048_009010 [Dryococelus australis]|uniref:Uncharacterized protein n=1 Tax=Dryococelus australis TaxID=614101 RepID=A0ABQ9HYP9_9NEOP|nr:hypothetical protein PR048_009010 [Dryococelus australis]